MFNQFDPRLVAVFFWFQLLKGAKNLAKNLPRAGCEVWLKGFKTLVSLEIRPGLFFTVLLEGSEQ